MLLLGLPMERPSHKMLAVLSSKGGSWSQAFYASTAETGDESAKICFIIWFAIRKHHNLPNAVLLDCFAKTDALYAHLTHRCTRNSW